MQAPAVQQFARRTFSGQLWRFLTVGTMNAVIDFLIYLFLTRGFDYWAEHFLQANGLAFLVANFNSFMWNRFWTFTARHGNFLQQYVTFLIVSVIYLLFIQSGLWLLVSVAGVFDLVAKVIVVSLGMMLYFIVLRQVVFWRKLRSGGMVETLLKDG